MVAKIFIDGEAGTTGLQIRERLAGRRDLEVLSIAADKRKDLNERKRLLNAAEICAELQDPVNAGGIHDGALRANVKRFLGYVVPAHREVTRDEYAALRAKMPKADAEMTGTERAAL